jgi:hypothetical protein
MKYLLLSCALISASPVMAGGPVVIEETEELVLSDTNRKTPGWLLPVLGLAVIAIIASSGGNGGGEICNGDPDPVDPGC